MLSIICSQALYISPPSGRACGLFWLLKSSASNILLHWKSVNYEWSYIIYLVTLFFYHQIIMDLFCSSIFVIIFSRPGQSQGLLHKHLCHWFINWSTDPLVKISLLRHHAQMVINGVSNHKINYICIFRTFKVLKGIPMAVLVQKLRRFCWMDGFWLLMELHQEGFAPGACAAGL